MRPTQGVSFPRSGHGAVYHVLRRYFGEALVYCDTDNPRHCGCRSVPCIDPARTYAKNHDFGLRNRLVRRRTRWFGVWTVPSGFKGVPVLPDERYLVQYRAPVPAIASDFTVFVTHEPRQNHARAWRRFALKEIAYWNRFVDKWVLGFPGTRHAPHYCSYERLLADPESCIRKILQFMSDGPLDEPRLQSVLEQTTIEPRRSLQSFSFSDAGFFRELEAMAYPRLQTLGLPSFAD